MKSIVCLISGRGSNLEAIIRRAQAENWRDCVPAEISAVISSRADAPGLAIARAAGVKTQLVDHREHSPAAFEHALIEAIGANRSDLLVLAGFMRILSREFVARYEGRMINIHPSLLPAFPGLRTHRQALAAGVRVHGATVHYVSSEVDAGPIIAQAAVPVLPDDDEQTLAERVLAREHVLLPSAVRWCCEGRVRLSGGRVVLRDLTIDQMALLA